jgi:hypothetical protein
VAVDLLPVVERHARLMSALGTTLLIHDVRYSVAIEGKADLCRTVRSRE